MLRQTGENEALRSPRNNWRCFIGWCFGTKLDTSYEGSSQNLCVAFSIVARGYSKDMWLELKYRLTQLVIYVWLEPSPGWMCCMAVCSQGPHLRPRNILGWPPLSYTFGLYVLFISTNNYIELLFGITILGMYVISTEYVPIHNVLVCVAGTSNREMAFWV